MRSLKAAVATLLSCAIASPTFADPPPRPTTIVAVLEFRSAVAGVDPAALAEAVRSASKDALPSAALVSRDEIAALLPDLVPGCARDCAVRAGRSLIADLIANLDAEAPWISSCWGRSSCGWTATKSTSDLPASAACSPRSCSAGGSRYPPKR